MGPTNRYQNADYLRGDQYKNSRNLGDRAQLHHRFSTNPVNWLNWIFPFLDLQSQSNVLECGSGPGWLWRNNLDRIPDECCITVTDLSPGMVDEAKESLASSDHDFTFQETDIANLPFEDDSFDVVVANHMLYHVPDRNKALSETQRVLKPNGLLVATTVGKDHMHELRELARQLAPELENSFKQANITFTLENGRAQLEPWFASVELHYYESNLKVTEVEPILAYVLSSSEVRASVDEQSIQSATLELERMIFERGTFNISTNSGLFRARSN